MQIILPFNTDLNNISITTPPTFSNSPYLNKSTENGNMLTMQDILIQLEAALSDKDWEAIELLKEEVEYQAEQDSYQNQGYDQFVEDDLDE